MAALMASGCSDAEGAWDCVFSRYEVASLDKLFPAIAAQLYNDASCGKSRMESSFTDQIDIQDEALTEAALFPLYVEEDRAWHASPLIAVYNPGSSGIFEDLESSRREVVAIFGILDGNVRHLMAVMERSEYQRERLGLMDELGAAAAEGEAAETTGDAALPIVRKSGVTVRFVPAKGNVAIEARKDLDPSQEPGMYSLETFPVRCPDVGL